MLHHLARSCAVVSLGLLLACAVNPATGRRQLMLVSEAQEVAMGREADSGLVQELGLYDDAELAGLVERLGAQLAAVSERPDLPWTFRVVDDPAVNAFALPGGFIYVTRGILAHLDSEAELAGVLGHEIGHVTARHSASQISRSQLAQVGLGVGAILAPEDVRPFLGLAQSGLGLLLLKHSRDAEREADSLGVRYMTQTGSPPAALLDVFGVLAGVSAASGGSRLPGWLSTHPTPEDRQQRIGAELAALPDEARNAPRRREELLARLDGIVYGEDPREGFFVDSRFVHPTLRFELRFPEGWPARNARSQVSALSPEQDAALVLTLAAERSPGEALDAFLRRQGVESGGPWIDRVAGGAAASRLFGVRSSSGEVRGGVAFFSHGGRVYAMIGYASARAWASREPAARRAILSFSRLDDARLLGVQPQRLSVSRLGRATTLAQLHARNPDAASLDTLALLNRADAQEGLPAGSWVKRIVGERP
jgi:predicted Zn-dependent protease